MRSLFAAAPLAAVLFLSSCASSRMAEQDLRERWVGRTETELVAELGPPSFVRPGGNGKSVIYARAARVGQEFVLSSSGEITAVRAFYGTTFDSTWNGPMSYSTNHPEFLPPKEFSYPYDLWSSVYP